MEILIFEIALGMVLSLLAVYGLASLIRDLIEKHERKGKRMTVSKKNPLPRDTEAHT